MTLFSTEIWGLDLVLGGGVQGISRAENPESATLLLRGAPGAGKTVLGAHLASALARGLGCYVAYGYVELPCRSSYRRSSRGSRAKNSSCPW